MAAPSQSWLLDMPLSHIHLKIKYITRIYGISAGYQHIRDWESLMFLLPREYCRILSEDPELKKYAENIEEFGRSLICTSVLNDQQSPSGVEVKTTYASSSSCGTQPSSGYRSSSTMLLTDSGGSPFKYDEHKSADRPPLPKGILRNPVLQNIKCRKNLMNTKRSVSENLGLSTYAFRICITRVYVYL